MKKPNIPIGKISSENQKIQNRKQFYENWDRIFGEKCPHQTKDGCELVDICENDEVEGA